MSRLRWNVSLVAACTAGALWLAVPLEATVITVIEDHGNSLIDHSQDGEIDFDIVFNNNDPVRLQVTLTGGDVGAEGIFAFSGFFVNLTGTFWTDFHIMLFGGPFFSREGDFETSGVGFNIQYNGPGTMALILFGSPGEDAFAILGDPNDTIDPEDWLINTGDILDAGQSFEMLIQPTGNDTTPTPEPGALALIGTALIALLARRQRGA
jgi:hypothetical protein